MVRAGSSPRDGAVPAAPKPSPSILNRETLMHSMRSLVRAAVAAAAGGTFLAGAALGQIRHPGTPASEMFDLPAEVDTVVLDAPDVARLKAEDAVAPEVGPLRYGAVLSTSLGLDNAGTWTELDDYGLRVWRLRLVSPGAFTLGVTFD